MRYLDNPTVARCLPMTEAADVLRQAYVQVLTEAGASLPRWRPASGYHVLAAIHPPGYGIKVITPAAQLFYLYRWPEGEPLAVMEAGYLSELRTALTTALAVDALANSDARCHALLGSGRQAPLHAEAVRQFRPHAELRVWSPTPSHREALAARCEGQAVDSVEAALRGADIITTVTRSTSPVFPADWVEPGCHITAVGATHPDTREIGADTVARARLIVVDDLEAAQAQAGDLLMAGADWKHVLALGQVLKHQSGSGWQAGSITLCKTLGVGFGDVALAMAAYHRAKAEGLGDEWPFPRNKEETP